MIINIMDVCQLKHCQFDISNSLTSLMPLLEKVFGIHSVNMQKKNVTTNVVINKACPKKLWIDSSRISQIMNNFISNALKYTQSSGNINVYITWCIHETSQEDLLKPIMKSS